MRMLRYVCFFVLLLYVVETNGQAPLSQRRCQRSRPVTYYVYVTRYGSQRYESCSWCWNLGKLFRCCNTRYRQTSTRVQTPRTRSQVYYVCCSGWSGSSCQTHNRYPIVTSCPSTRSVTASGDKAIVSWPVPTFREPYGYRLTVASSYSKPEAELAWGRHRIAYTATSTNNNRQRRCTFYVNVQAPKMYPIISKSKDFGRCSPNCFQVTTVPETYTQTVYGTSTSAHTTWCADVWSHFRCTTTRYHTTVTYATAQRSRTVITGSCAHSSNSACEIPTDSALSTGSTIDLALQEGMNTSLLCSYITNGNRSIDFQWTWGEDVKSMWSTRYAFIEHPINKGYFVAFSQLDLRVSRLQENKTAMCQVNDSFILPPDTNTTAILRIDYDPDPSVDFCPPSPRYISASRHLNVTLEQPRFSDVNGDRLEVVCNMEGTQLLSHGVHPVLCEATNSRTLRTATCQYNVTIATTKCSTLPSAPGGGAVICGSWENNLVTLCQYLCAADRDISPALSPFVPYIASCTFDGEWFPPTESFNCTEPRQTPWENMPSGKHYLPAGSDACEDPGPVLEAFHTAVRQSCFQYVCDNSDDCAPDSFTFICDPQN